MTNREFIERLKKARARVEAGPCRGTLTLVLACERAGINWLNVDERQNATFGCGNSSEFGHSTTWLLDQEDFPDYKTASLAVIDNSIAALEKEVSK